MAAAARAGIHLTEVLSACVDLAVVASCAIKKLVATGGATLTQDKSQTGEFDPQTVADLTSQHIIVDSLRAKWPHLQIIGEEGALDADPTLIHSPQCKILQEIFSGPHRSGWDAAWDGELKVEDLTVFVDPLDGTREFTEGIHSAVTVLIGIAYRGLPVAGVIEQPWFTPESGRCMWGCSGYGIYTQVHTGVTASDEWNELESFVDVPGRCIIGTSRSHGRAELDNAVENSGATDVIRSGGAGNKVIQLLEGTIDCYLYPVTGTKRWDTCAGEALIRTSGGVLTDREGKPYKYLFDEDAVVNDRGVIAVRNETALQPFIDACRYPAKATL